MWRDPSVRRSASLLCIANGSWSHRPVSFAGAMPWPDQALLLCVRMASSLLIATLTHELFHFLAARLLGWNGPMTIELGGRTDCAAVCHLPGLDSRSKRFVRHAGWFGSVCLALAATCLNVGSVQLFPLWWTAAGAVTSDLLGWHRSQRDDVFACGNFGVLILRATSRKAVFRTLSRMLRITMVRGAQSAGVVTYEDQVGLRCRVVNGKRTNLADLLLAKVQSEIGGGSTGAPYPSAGQAWRLFQGHTRFATSSSIVAPARSCPYSHLVLA